MPLAPSTMHQTRCSIAPVASSGVRAHQSGPPRRATTPSRRAGGRRAPATRLDRLHDDATTLRPLVAASTSSSSSAAAASGRPPSKPVSVRLPIGPGDQADQAAAACVAAWRETQPRRDAPAGGDGARLLVELSLPLVGATDLDDWPGGIRQQFKAARPMVERMLSAIRRQADGGGGFFGEAPRSSLWDDADAVCAYDSPKLACVVFPTAETLKQLDALACRKDKVKGGLTIIVNPQWTTRGSQLISDFGIGPWRAANEAKAGSFKRAFCLRSVRIRGDEARVWYSRAAELDFKAGKRAAAAAAAAAEQGSENEREEQAAGGGTSPRPTGPWNVFLVTATGSMAASSRLISSGDSEPSYSELEALLRDKGNVATKGWLERAQSEARFLKDSL